MNTIKKLTNHTISKTQMLIVKGGQEDNEEAAQVKTSRSRPLTGFFGNA